MDKVKSFFLSLGQFILGFVGWLFVSTWFNWNIVLEYLQFDDFMFYPTVIINQLIGLGIAFLTFRLKLRWIGIGILCGFGLYLVGSIVHGCGVPPLLLPFPLSLMSGC